jgi:hypothetical protein
MHVTDKLLFPSHVFKHLNVYVPVEPEGGVIFSVPVRDMREPVLFPVWLTEVVLLQLSLQMIVLPVTVRFCASTKCNLQVGNVVHADENCEFGAIMFVATQSPVTDLTVRGSCPTTLLMVSLTVIIAVPALIAVTSPVLLMEAIVGLTDFQM